MSWDYPAGVSDRDIDYFFGEEDESERERDIRLLREEQEIDDYMEKMAEKNNQE